MGKRGRWGDGDDDDGERGERISCRCCRDGRCAVAHGCGRATAWRDTRQKVIKNKPTLDNKLVNIITSFVLL